MISTATWEGLVSIDLEPEACAAFEAFTAAWDGLVSVALSPKPAPLSRADTFGMTVRSPSRKWIATCTFGKLFEHRTWQGA